MKRVVWTVVAPVRWGLAVVLMMGLLRSHGPQQRTDVASMVDHLVPHLESLEARLDEGAGEDMQTWFPEGYFFSHALVGMTWMELAAQTPADHPVRDTALARARPRLLALESAAGRSAFPRDLDTPFGIFYRGWAQQLRIRMSGGDASLRDSALSECEVLATALRREVWSASYVDQRWPVDTVVAASSLGLCSKQFGGRYDADLADWVSRARREVSASGAIGHQDTENVSRATSLALMPRFLMDVDPTFAMEQYDLLAAGHLSSRFGLPVVQEYVGVAPHAGDVDSGPLIWGVSLSATVVGAGTARRLGDHAFADDVFGLGDLVGMELPSSRGRTWALGVLPVGEAFVAWSKVAERGPVRPRAHVAWFHRWWEALGWLLIMLLFAPDGLWGVRLVQNIMSKRTS